MKLSALRETFNRVFYIESTMKASKHRPLLENENDPIESTLAALSTLAQDNNIPLAVIGGLALAHHRFVRNTKDVDVIVNAGDFDTFLRAYHEYGFTTINRSNYMLDLLYEHPRGDEYTTNDGEKIRGVQVEVMKPSMNDTPTPQEMGVTHGLGYADLYSLVLMKLKAGRFKDIADLVELLKRQSQSEIEELEYNIGYDHPEHVEMLDHIITSMRSEKLNEERRRNRT